MLTPQIPSFLIDEMIGFDLEGELCVILNGGARPVPKPVEPEVLDIGWHR